MNDTKTLLIVEQDSEVAHAMTAHFEGLGYEVDSSPDGLDAFTKIDHEPPRVVVMGLTTPRLGGVDAMRLLRRRHPDLSIVLADSDRLPRRAPHGAPGDGGSDREWQPLDRLVALAAAQPSAGASSAPREEPRQPSTAESSEPARILVVDDLEDIRDLLRDVLEADGYAVEVAGDAHTAISKFASVRPQVVLLDISMPGLSGISALQQLRARDPNVGVIMVTGNGDESMARQTLALGAFDYICKPIDFDYLRRSIKTLLAMRTLIPAPSQSEADILQRAL